MWRHIQAGVGESGAGTLAVGYLLDLWLAVRVRLLAERERWILWLPVGFGIGIAGYFTWPVEPPGWLGFVGTGFAALFALQARGRTWVLLGALALGAVAGGFGVAQLRTHLVAAPVLQEEHGPARVQATVVEVEPRETGARLLLDAPEVARLAPGKTPARVRVTVVVGVPENLAPGDQVRLLAVLDPPPAPAAYDFARRAYFERLGSVGYALGAVERLGPAAGAAPTGWDLWWAQQRQTIAAEVRDTIPGRAGTVAVALMPGERGEIPEDVLQAMRDSGLAHLLAISGLHIGLIADLVFFATRAAIALVPALALRVHGKKWAALAAALAGFAYLWLVGATVPTQRAFLMLTVILLAVAVDRSALTMRLVAGAAFVVLLLHPEALVGASFQMSFAAATALVAAYETVRTPGARRGRPRGGIASLALYFGGVALTSVVAILATGPFAIFHFNRLALYGLAANMVAVPLTALWIMPMALVAFVLMPLGLHVWPLQVMGWGIEGMLRTADTVSAWPGAVRLLPSPTLAGLAAIALGGLWVCLWQRPWRLLGLLPVALGLLTMLQVRTPDILVSGDSRLLAVSGRAGYLWLSTDRRADFTADVWLRQAGQRHARLWPRVGAAQQAGLNCDPLGCIFRKQDTTVALVRDGRALAEDCRVADIVVALMPVSRARCSAPRLLVDRFDLWRAGGHAIYLGRDSSSDIQVETVRQYRGERPWVRRPEEQ